MNESYEELKIICIKLEAERDALVEILKTIIKEVVSAAIKDTTTKDQQEKDPS